MGNIQSLTRNGFQDNGVFINMDVLDYDYDSGNKLTKVTDTGNTTHGFKDGANQAIEYTYDLNANMKTDANKGITDIEYNHLNLPTKVTINGNGNNGTIEYIYDAVGVRLKKIVTDGSSVTTTEYAGNYIYENDQLQFFSTSEGYVSVENNNSYSYVYNFLDHLGNNRLSYTDSNNDGTITGNEIVKESNYYPFGLQHKGYNNTISALGNSIAKRYMFGGKELNEELGLGWYDVSARNYDPALGRWMNLDPLSEFMFTQSPYNYAFNNPIYFIDPDGLMPSGGQAFEGYYDDGAGNVVYDPNINSQKDLDALGIDGASFIGDDYYDSSSNTYYDENGVAHENYERNSLYPSKFRWSFSLWLKNLTVEGNAVERIGSGFVLRGKANSNKSNNKSNNPEDDIEIPAEVVAALRGITGKYKGVAYKNGVKVLQNGFKDAKKVKRLKKEFSNIINGKGVYSNSTIDSQNYTIQDTTSYILQYWKNGIPMGGSGAGLKAGKKRATEAAKKEMKGSDLDSIQVIKMYN